MIVWKWKCSMQANGEHKTAEVNKNLVTKERTSSSRRWAVVVNVH